MLCYLVIQYIGNALKKIPEEYYKPPSCYFYVMTFFCCGGMWVGLGLETNVLSIFKDSNSLKSSPTFHHPLQIPSQDIVFLDLTWLSFFAHGPVLIKHKDKERQKMFEILALLQENSVSNVCNSNSKIQNRYLDLNFLTYSWIPKWFTR